MVWETPPELGVGSRDVMARCMSAVECMETAGGGAGSVMLPLAVPTVAGGAGGRSGIVPC